MGDGLVPGAGTRRWGVLCPGHLAVGHVLSFTAVAQHAQRAGKEGRRQLGGKPPFRLTCSHGQVVLREMTTLNRIGETAFLLSPLCCHCCHCFLPCVLPFACRCEGRPSFERETPGQPSFCLSHPPLLWRHVHRLTGSYRGPALAVGAFFAEGIWPWAFAIY